MYLDFTSSRGGPVPSKKYESLSEKNTSQTCFQVGRKNTTRGREGHRRSKEESTRLHERVRPIMITGIIRNFNPESPFETYCSLELHFQSPRTVLSPPNEFAAKRWSSSTLQCQIWSAKQSDYRENAKNSLGAKTLLWGQNPDAGAKTPLRLA